MTPTLRTRRLLLEPYTPADEEDFVAQLFVASTHDTLMMFTNQGRVYARTSGLKEGGGVVTTW